MSMVKTILISSVASIIVSTASVAAYDKFIANKNNIATANIDKILKAQITSLTKESIQNNLPQDELIKRNTEFGKKLLELSIELSNKHHVVLLPEPAVIHGAKMDLTDEIMRIMGVKDNTEDLFDLSAKAPLGFSEKIEARADPAVKRIEEKRRKKGANHEVN